MNFKEMNERLALHRQLRLSGDLTEEKHDVLASLLHVLSVEDDGQIDLFFDSGGGHARCGKWLADAIRFSRAPVRGIVSSAAFSAAFRVLQACHTRVAYPSAQMMFHHGRVDIYLDQISEPFKFLEQTMAETRQFLRDLAARSGANYRLIQRWAREAKKFSAQEALKLHFIDEILSPPAR